MAQSTTEPEESRKQITKSLLYAAFYFLKRKFFRRNIAVFSEVAVSDSLRVDVLCLSWNDQVTIIELKSCKEDFRADHKWQKYLNFCHYFYFMVPDGVIKPSELPEGTGLIYFHESEKGGKSYNIVRESKKFKGLGLTNKWFRTIYKRLAFRIADENNFYGA